MAYDLLTTIKNLDSIDFREASQLVLPSAFCLPGFWVVITSLAKTRGYQIDDIQFSSEDQRGYSYALGIQEALNGHDVEESCRPAMGERYSPLVKLDSADRTDQATSTINSCLRAFTPDNVGSYGLDQLCDVIGEVHSNVWDHGLNTGFSAAQKTKVPYADDYYFEFALADAGMGFKREMNRVGKNCETDEEAIAWCIEEGNSTKKSDDRDPLAQRLPMDASSEPFGTNVTTYKSDGNENHHQGLGLAKLVELVRKFSGELTIVSGKGVFTISPDGSYNYSRIQNAWAGVALSCRLRASRLFVEEEPPSAEVESIMKALME